MVSEDFITNKPILPSLGDCDVVVHGLSEPPVVGNNEQIDEDDIGKPEFVNDSGEVHVTEDREDDMNSVIIFLLLFSDHL